MKCVEEGGRQGGETRIEKIALFPSNLAFQFLEEGIVQNKCKEIY